MTRLDRYLLRRWCTVFLRACVGLVALVILIDFLTARQRDILRYEVPLSAVVQYYVTFASSVLFQYHAAAIAALLSGLLVLGRAAQDHELTAVLASGVSLRRLVRPLLAAGLAFSLGALLYGETLGVTANRTFLEVEREFFKRVDFDIEAGVTWPRLRGGWAVDIARFNPLALTGERVTMDNLDDRDNAIVVSARRIFWDPEREAWMLEDGTWSAFRRVGDEVIQDTARITLRPAPIVETPESLFALEAEPETFSASELAAQLERAQALGLRVQERWVAYWAKYAQPMLPAIMVLLSVPFAARLRRGNFAMSFGLSIGIGLVYVFLYFIGLGLGYLGEVPPFVAAWLANVVFLAAGVVLFIRTPT